MVSTEVRDRLNTHDYLKTLTFVRDFYEGKGFNPLFVGGVIAKALNLNSIEQARIDHHTKTIHIPINKAEYTAKRGDGTHDDFDLITQCSDFGQSSLAEAQIALVLKDKGRTNHFVSAEPVRCAHWPPRHKNLQFVSGIDVDDKGDTRFTFGNTISPLVSKETMETWNYIMEDQGEEVIRLPSFNPAVFGLRYLMRLPVAHTGGLRSKDQILKTNLVTQRATNKIHTLMKLREKAIQTGVKQGYKYDDSAWRDFILHLQHKNRQDQRTRLLSEAMDIWWNVFSPLSTATAHGWGPLNWISRMGNQFDGNYKKINI